MNPAQIEMRLGKKDPLVAREQPFQTALVLLQIRKEKGSEFSSLVGRKGANGEMITRSRYFVCCSAVNFVP